MTLSRTAANAAGPALAPTHSSSRLALSSLFTLALACTVSLLETVTAADPFQPVIYPATSILSSTLYVYGGLTNISSPTSYSSQFASLSLKDNFDTNNIPWMHLPANISTAMAPGAHSRDRRWFILGGSKNNIGHAPAIVFDSVAQAWSQAPNLPPKEGVADVMLNYHRDSPGMALDFRSSILVQFGGSNATSVTNDLTLLIADGNTGIMNWTYSGSLESVPPLFAPIVLYIPRNKQTLIMGGCDQMNFGESATPSHCATFDTLYTLSTESVATASTNPPIMSNITVNGTLPSPRFLPCAVVLPDSNVFMMGGGNLTTPLSDAWILNTQNWTWFRRDIEGLPLDGIMGHSCQLAEHNQILVIGGQSNDGFMRYPISVIKVINWAWTSQYVVPGFTTGIKVGLVMSIVVVVSAIMAGLWVRWRRNKMAALKKAQGKETKTNRPRRSRRTGTNQSRSRDIPDRQHRRQLSDEESNHDAVELQGIGYHSGERHHNDVPMHLNSMGLQEDGHFDPPNYDQHSPHSHHSSVDHVIGSPKGSSSSTIVG
ncbi:hypothetical protein BGX26_012955 [Mortierella sp. AD094]|nr:hypothetical protein BGX26_012955 [Mortierella sp. AD094]